MSMPRYACVLFLAVLAGPAGVALAQHGLTGNMNVGGNFSSLYSQFTRVYTDANGTQTIRGEFYYLEPGRIHFEVVHPLHQIVLMRDSLTTIYYPETKRGFLFVGSGAQVLPMIPGIVAALRPDYGLTDLGYQIKDQAVRGDTLVTFWTHPIGKEALGRFRLAQVDQQLAYVMFDLPEDKGTIKTTFEDYQPVGDIPFPSIIRTESILDSGPAMGQLSLSSITLNPDVPDRVSQFEIPDDADIERRVW